MPRGEEDPIFHPRDPNEQEEQGTNLADLILEKIAAYESGRGDEQPAVQGGGAPEDAVQIPAKAIEVYEKLACLLNRKSPLNPFC